MNNYDLVLSVMAERNLTSVDGTQFQKLLSMKSADYAADELNRSFGRLITFIKDYGSTVQHGNKNLENNSRTQVASDSKSIDVESSSPDDKINVREEEVESLLKEFHNNWKMELEKINSNIVKQFSNLKNGMNVFKIIMEELLDAYTLFVKIIKKYFKKLRLSKYFTPETEITYEMRKSFVTFE